MLVSKSRLVGCIPINSPMKSPVYQYIYNIYISIYIIYIYIFFSLKYHQQNPILLKIFHSIPISPFFFIDFPWIWPSFYIFQPLSTPVPWVSPGHTSRTLDLAQKGPKVKHKRPSNSTAPLTSGKTCWKKWEIGWYSIFHVTTITSILIVHYYFNMVMGQNLGTQMVRYFVG